MRLFVITIAVLILAVCGVYTAMLPRDPQIVWAASRAISAEAKAISAQSKPLDCGALKAAAVGTLEDGLVSSCGSSEALPVASMAKAITALVVLDAAGEENLGAEIALTSEDELEWERVVSENGTNIRVAAGEKLTKAQMLGGMLVSSANNLAESIARNQFGSFAAYKQAAAQFLQAKKLTKTTVGSDASGFSPDTLSSARDMFEIGRLILQSSSLKQIVAAKELEMPSAKGGVEIEKNTNILLEKGYVGIKTGYTEEAGGCLLFAKPSASGARTVVGVIMGDPDLMGRYASAEKIEEQMEQRIHPAQLIISAGQTLGELHYSNGYTQELVAAREINGQLIEGKSIKIDAPDGASAAPMDSEGSAGSGADFAREINAQDLEQADGADSPAPRYSIAVEGQLLEAKLPGCEENSGFWHFANLAARMSSPQCY